MLYLRNKPYSIVVSVYNNNNSACIASAIGVESVHAVRSYLTFLPRSLHNPFFDGTLADKPVNSHLFGLTQSVCAIHRLLVYRWIPVGIVKYHLL